MWLLDMCVFQRRKEEAGVQGSVFPAGPPPWAWGLPVFWRSFLLQSEMKFMRSQNKKAISILIR